MKKSLTFRYSLHQMAYWAAVAGVVSFASAYLLAKGFTAGQVGVLLAAGNLLSCTAQPLLAARADRSGGKTVFRMTLGLTLAAAVCFAVPELLALPRWAFGALYLLGVFATDAMIPLMNAISVACNAAGRPVNYGFGRGMGSLAFSGVVTRFWSPTSPSAKRTPGVTVTKPSPQVWCTFPASRGEQTTPSSPASFAVWA